MSASPPRLPRAMLWSALPAAIRCQLVGDLDQEFSDRLAALRRGRLWYWRQAIASLPYAWQLRRRHSRRSQEPPRPLLALRLADAARDARHGLRLLGRQPLLALSVTVTIALGVGASTSVLTMAHAVLLRGLPYDDADRLVSVAEIDTRRETASGNVSWPDFLDYRSQVRTLSAVAGHSGGSRTLVGAGPPDRVVMTEVTPGFFALLGVRPALGRDFSDSDFLDGTPLSMILSDGAWRRRFGADPDVVGRRVELGGVAVTIAGVLPASFEFPLRGLAEIWLPIRPSQAQRERRYFHWLDVIGRLQPEATAAQAEAELRAIAAGFAAIDPQYHPAAGVRVTSLNDQVVGGLRPIALVLAGAAVLLLTGACASIAGVLLARGLSREHEIGVRVAIGAGRGRIVRQLVVESVALALPGAVMGLVAGGLALRAFIAMLPIQQRMSLPHLDAVGLDPMMLAASSGIALVAVLICGLAPARQAGRWGSTAVTLRSRSSSPRETRAQTLFVAAQIALALILITGAALIGRSLTTLLAVNPGFDPAGLLTFRVNLTPARSTSADAVRAFHDDMLRALRSLPGVRGAATINQMPLMGANNTGAFTVQGESGLVQHDTLVRTAGEGYFDLLRLARVDGRMFAHTDGPSSPRVVVVNKLLAETAFGGKAVGRQISFPFFDGQPWWEIVGVVGNEQFDAIDRAMRPVVYFPYAQTPGGSIGVMMRVDGDPAAFDQRIRQAVAGVDPTTPVFGIQSLTQFVEASNPVFRRRIALTIVTGFALAALALAAVGLYGAVALMVSRRTREIGIRQALGATRGQILGGMLRHGLGPVAIGLTVGLGASLALGPYLATLLFGIRPSDPLTIASAVIVLLLVTVVAALVPARQALRVDAVTALRQE